MILGLHEPFDRNNNDETKADNLGQALFLVWLVAGTNHPAVAKVLAELPGFEKQDTAGKFILGRSDFADHPVNQTKCTPPEKTATTAAAIRIRAGRATIFTAAGKVRSATASTRRPGRHTPARPATTA